VAIPKTMDNDVPGTDYCIGFSTCVTRTIQLTNTLRTSAGSHERFLVLDRNAWWKLHSGRGATVLRPRS